jgi:hypothetical protein
VAKGILGEEPSRSEKPRQLAALRDRGVYLIDLSLDPVAGVDLAECVPDLIQRAKELQPRRVILIKSDVYDHAYDPLVEAGQPVVDVRIPFCGRAIRCQTNGMYALASAIHRLAPIRPSAVT